MFHARRDERAVRTLRGIMDFLDAARFCPQARCRRARRCRDRKIDCAFRNRALLVDEIFPILALRLAEEGQADDGRDDDPGR